MSSLVASVRKRGLHPPGFNPSLHPAALGAMASLIVSHETPKVNIQNVANDLIPGHTSTFDGRDFEDITPPFGALWFEWTLETMRLGALVRRCIPSSADIASFDLWEDSEVVHVVSLHFFREVQGCCSGPLFEYRFPTNSFGEAVGHQDIDWGFNASLLQTDEFRQSGLGAEEFTDQAKACLTFPVLESIVRMNTEGTVITPIKGARVKHAKHGMLPACVWHTIEIGAFKRISGGQNCFTHEAAERREHWVRAHRKDYRKGNGLFGRIKALIWIPEHKRGNPELGCVIPEFRIL